MADPVEVVVEAAVEFTQQTPRGDDTFEPPKYLKDLIAAINDAAKAAQANMLLFMLVGLYLLASAFSATDEDLLLGKAVTISQIGASLPVSFSFAIAPLVFVFLHVYALTRYDMLATNVRYFLGKLRAAVPRHEDQEQCRQLLANVEFVQTLTAPRGSSLHSRFWPLLTLTMMAGFPVVVLLLVQINALRYQSELINWVQRAWLWLDLLAIFVFFARNPLNGRALGPVSRSRSALHWVPQLGLPLLIVVLNWCYLNVVSADEDVKIVRVDLDRWKQAHDGKSPTVSDVIARPLDLLLCPQLKWGCRYLRVDHRTLVDHVWDDKAMAALRADGGDRAAALAGIEGVVLRGRTLRFAVLDESRLYAADLIGADLSRSSLDHAQLPGAKLGSAQLQGASLHWAQLQGADLELAQLQGADLSMAQLQGANLHLAQLQGADLVGANLQGTDFFVAQLQGAVLGGAQLQGADLRGAQLQGANLHLAQLQGANLRGAGLWNIAVDAETSFGLSTLRGAEFTGLSEEQVKQLLAELPAVTPKRAKTDLR